MRAPDFTSNPGLINEKHKRHLLTAVCPKQLCSSLLAPPAFCKKKGGINKRYGSQIRLTDLGKSTQPQLVCLMSQLHNYGCLRERLISPRYVKCHQPVAGLCSRMGEVVLALEAEGCKQEGRRRRKS